MGFSMDSTVTINQPNNTTSRILRGPKAKHVKQLRRLGFSPLIQVYNKNISNDKKLNYIMKNRIDF